MRKTLVWIAWLAGLFIILGYVILGYVLKGTPRVSCPDPVTSETGLFEEEYFRVVWCQDRDLNADVFGEGPNLKLMGYDSRDGRGEREILPDSRNYNKPMLTPSGKCITFTDFNCKKAYVVDWDGSNLRQFTDGQVLGTWLDPDTGVEYILVQSGPARGKDFDVNPVYRHPVNNLDQRELIWDAAPVSRDNFQLSADGRRAGGQFPWPRSGIANMQENSWTKTGRGCWTSFAPDNSYLFWILDGSHRFVTMCLPDEDKRWKVRINTAPGMNGAEVYHPRWSNRVRYLTMSGPYRIRKGSNNIRGGGPDVEIYLGRFNRSFTEVEKWFRITHNRRADFFPDVWIEDTGQHEPSVALQTREREVEPVSSLPEQEPGRIEVLARLKEISKTPTLAAIAPYRSAIVVYSYEIEKVLRGDINPQHILVAHWAILDGETIIKPPALDRNCRLVLERFDAHPELEGERLIMETEDITSPFYYDVGRPSKS